MTDQRDGAPKYRLLRVEGTAAESRAIAIDLFSSYGAAVAAAARLPRQPAAAWAHDPVDGVWNQLDTDGQGFVIHRISVAL